MEISQADLRIGDHSVNFQSISVKKEIHTNQRLDFNTTNENLPEESDSYSSIDIKENILHDCQVDNETCPPILQTLTSLDPNLNAIQHNEASNINSILSESLYVSSLDSESISGEIQKQGSSFGTNDNYNIPAVNIPSELLEDLNLNIKKEDETYSTEWLCDVNEDPGIKLKITKNIKLEEVDTSSDIEDTVVKCRNDQENKIIRSEKPKRNVRQRSVSRPDCRERLRKKAERMRERRKQIYETESTEQRLDRLAKEAAKRREMRMYYETPDQKRKRLDAEAARKREYRMYNETPDERRKRLDREAEKRRLKRLNMYANETPDQKRERLNKESAKRREARLNQYAKETDDQRKERLKRDAIRAKEMRFTRSAIETDDERRERLIKDALRKRELRMSGRHSESNFTELQTVRSFEELNDPQVKEESESQVSGHYLSNWMVWFQNTLTQQVQSAEESVDPQPSKG